MPVCEHEARVVLGLARSELDDLDFERADTQVVAFEGGSLDQTFGRFRAELAFEQLEHPGTVGL